MSRMRLSWCLLLVVVLSGCVSTGQPQRQANTDQMLDNHLQLALGYIGTGNRESARHHLHKAEELRRRAPGVLHAYALLYQSEGELELADDYYRRAIAADRHFSQARFNYGVYLYNQTRFNDALEQFQRVTEDLDYERRSLAFTYLGITAVQLGQQEAAATAFRRAVRLDPTQARAYLELARLEFDHGNFSTAKQWLDQHNRLSQATPASLWLGLRLARVFGDRDTEASNAMALRNLFPYSEETLAYQDWLQENDGRQ